MIKIVRVLVAVISALENKSAPRRKPKQCISLTILSLKDKVIKIGVKSESNDDTYKSQMTFEPVLQPRRVTMWLRIQSYS